MIAARKPGGVSRRGMASLIEVLASMAMMAALFAMIAGMLHLLMRLERLNRDELAATVALGRLATDLRADVHTAVSAGIEESDREESSDQLFLKSSGERSARYRIEDGALHRVQDDPAGGRRIERYRLPDRTRVRWQRIETDSATVIALVLERSRSPRGERSATTSTTSRIEAVLGRDHRFERVDE